MPTTQVLAMSVVCQGGEEEASKLPLHKILEQIHPDLERKVVGNKAFLQIGDCEVFENLYNNCIGERERLEQQFPDLSPKFYLALAKGEDYDVAKTIAHELLAAVVFNQAEIPDHVLCYITKEIYDQLPPKYRDNYHSSTAMRADIKAHRRFSEGGLDCFVVSPIGTEETVFASVPTLFSSTTSSPPVRRPTIGPADPI